MRRTSPNILYVGDLLIGEDGLWRVVAVHPELRAVMADE